MSLPILDKFRNMLVGRILTIIGAAFSDPAQRDDVKSLVRQAIQLSLSELEDKLRGETQTEM